MQIAVLGLLLFSWISFASGQSNSSLLTQLEVAFKNAVNCPSCLTLLGTLQELANLGDSTFVTAMTALCDGLKLEDPDVCAGEFQQLGPIVSHDLRQINSTAETAMKLCDAVFGLCQPPPVTPYTVQFPKPAPAITQVSKPSGKQPIQVVHFSDVHIDTLYAVGSDANCTEPMCCRNYANETGPVQIPAGPFGTGPGGKCDPPNSLAVSMLQAIQEIAPSAKFSLFTGDVAPHDVWSITNDELAYDLVAFNAELVEALHAPVYSTLGNHDAVPVNSFPRNTTTGNATAEQWVFDLSGDLWAPYIGGSAAEQVMHYSGSFAAKVPGLNLWIISLNTNYWYIQNFWLYDSDEFQPDPNGILAFLVDTFQTAEDSGSSAWIIGHIPVGTSDTLSDQSNYYNQIALRYSNTIKGHFFGHTHYDQFQVGYSDYSNRNASTAFATGWICPSLTPTSGNPAFKVYDVDPDTFEIMDSHVYITNISAPGFQSGPTWELFYSARETYGPLVPSLTPSDPLSPAFWHNLTEVFIANATAFDIYNAHTSRDALPSDCTDSCKSSTICQLQALRAEDNCDVVKPGISFRRDLESSSVSHREDHHDECESSGASALLRQLVVNTASGLYSEADFDRLRAQLRAALPGL